MECGAALPEDVVANSAGGVGSGQWGQLPTNPHERLTDQQFVTAARLRMGYDVFRNGGACQHRNRDTCGHPRDLKGRHALTCATGGGTVARHNRVRDALFSMISEKSPTPVHLEPHNGILDDEKHLTSCSGISMQSRHGLT